MPLRLIKNDLGIDFVGQWKWAAGFSVLSLLAGLILYFPLGGFNYGIDFRGGTVVQVRFAEAQDLGELRSAIAASDLGAFEMQEFGGEDTHEVLISLAGTDSQEQLGGKSLGERVEEFLKAKYPGLEIRRVETVGPKVGSELKEAAFLAVAIAVILIMLYVWVRFEWRYGVAALIATAHDVLFVLAVFIWNQHEITLPVVAAILTVAGYSINDTIVILDRIRDNLRRFQKMPFREVINNSINQTLSRTTLTSGTTLLVVFAIYFFGGEIIHDFAFALMIGILIGTFSSIWTASPLLILLRHWFPVKAS